MIKFSETDYNSIPPKIHKNLNINEKEKIRLVIGCTASIYSEALKSLFKNEKFIKVVKICVRKPNLILCLEEIEKLKADIFSRVYQFKVKN